MRKYFLTYKLKNQQSTPIKKSMDTPTKHKNAKGCLRSAEILTSTTKRISNSIFMIFPFFISSTSFFFTIFFSILFFISFSSQLFIHSHPFFCKFTSQFKKKDLSCFKKIIFFVLSKRLKWTARKLHDN